MMAYAKDYAAKELAELGDVQERLRLIENQVSQMRLRITPELPVEKGELVQWLVYLATHRKKAVDMQKPLPEIQERAYLLNTVATVQQGGAFDRNDVDRLNRYFHKIATDVDNNLKTFTDYLAININLIPEKLANHFLSKDQEKTVHDRLDKAQLLASEAAEFDKRL